MTRWQRAVALGGALAVAVLLTGRAAAESSMDYTVNGSTTLLVFDANRNGVIPDAGDCVVTGKGTGGVCLVTDPGTGDCVVTGPGPGGGDFALTMAQHATGGAVPLQICQPCYDNNNEGLGTALVNGPQYMGDGFVSATDAGAAIRETCLEHVLGTPFVSINLRGSSPSPSPSPVTRAVRDNGPLLMPVAGTIFNDEGPVPENLGSGFLCAAGGSAAVAIEGRGGLRLLVGLKRVSSGGQAYQCVSVPMPRADTGVIEMIDSCVPVDSQNRSVLALNGLNLAGVDLAMLPACAGERVPTASEAGLVVLALALIGGGAAVLARRETFRRAMPQF